MKISLIDLQAQFSAVESSIRRRIDSVLAHGQYIMGPEVAELESALAEYVGVRHVISCSSGTDALLMPLMAYGVGPGDAVFTSSYTFVATAEVISLLGATPIFVDIDPVTFNLHPQSLETAVASVEAAGELRPCGVIAVDLFGLPADYSEIEKTAARHGLFVIEDAAQSFGGRCGSGRAGSFGDVAATSFFPAKPLGCYGDGGAVFTNRDELAEELRSIRIHGKGECKYDNRRIGLNARLDTLQAAVLLAKLEIFDGELDHRQQVAERYTTKLSEYLRTPLVPASHLSAWAQYTVITDGRDAIAGCLKAAGVPTGIYYPKPLHGQTAFAELSQTPNGAPHSEWAAARALSLPMHPYLDVETQDIIIDAVIQAIGE